jgi:hypothetical protein
MAKAKPAKTDASSANAAKPGDLVLVNCNMGEQKGILLQSANPGTTSA